MHTWPAPVIEGSRGVLILTGAVSPKSWGHCWRNRSGRWCRDAGGPLGYIRRAAERMN